MSPRKLALGLAASLSLLPLAAWAAEVKLTGVHNCCPGCTKPIMDTLNGLGATNIKTTPTEVSFSTADAAGADKAVKALFDAGFSGKVEGAKTPEVVGSKLPKSKTVKVAGVHNCCGACMRGIQEAIKPFGASDLKARATSFTITSDKEIEPDAVIKALRAAGYSARAEKPAE